MKISGRPRKRPKIDVPKDMVIIQDTREQKPLFSPAPYIIDKNLKTGDYSIAGMEEMVTIERKTIGDLYGTLGRGRDRFEKELRRMSPMLWKGLLIEGTEDDMMRGLDLSVIDNPKKKNVMTPNKIYHSLSSLEVQGLHVYYARGKKSAREWVLSRLTRFYKHFRGGKLWDAQKK